MAAQMPPEIRLTLRAGTVYYFPHRALTSPEPHFFVVVNTHPLDDQILLLAVLQSNIDSVRRRRQNMPSGTLVEISPAEYDELRVRSIVDCNHIFRKSLAELIEDRRVKSLRAKKDIPKHILAKIQAGVKSSPRVEEEAKKLIR